MYFNGPLFLWLFRRVRLITLLGMILALAYTLWESDLLFDSANILIFLFTLIHSVLLVWQFGRVRSRAFGFLYTQGYSRDAIWGHMMLANAASVFLVWFPSALAIWTGLRCHVQELMHNYNFPVMSPLEQNVPWWPLLFYLFFLPVFHYAWIRNLQPTRAPVAGVFMVIAMFCTSFCALLAIDAPFQGIARWLIYGGLTIASISLFFGGWRLHRRLEVTS